MMRMRTSSDSRARHRVLIGLGSNLGDRVSFLRSARRAIAALPETRVLAASAVFETAPVGGPPQGPYLNACLAIETGLEPHALLAELQRIEALAGRVRGERNAPRTLDLDILLFGEAEIEDGRLTLPHPRFPERAFALVPAAEIAAAWRVPRRGELAALAARVDRAGVRRAGGEEDWR